MKIVSVVVEFFAELFSYLAEVYRRSRFRINHIIVYPIAFLYSEILLKVLAHTQAHVAYMLVFDIGIICLATGLTALFNKTINRILTVLVLTANGVYFGVECSLRQLDAIYEDIIPLIQSGDFPQTFLEALPLVLLFLIPMFLYLLLGSDHLPAVRRQPVFCGLLLLAFFVFTFMGSVVGAHGRYAPYYKSVDSFNESTEVFGLYTSTRLDLKWRFLGNGPTYEEVRAQSNTPETDIGSKAGDGASEESTNDAQTTDDEQNLDADSIDSAEESTDMTEASDASASDEDFSADESADNSTDAESEEEIQTEDNPVG